MNIPTPAYAFSVLLHHTVFFKYCMFPQTCHKCTEHMLNLT